MDLCSGRCSITNGRKYVFLLVTIVLAMAFIQVMSDNTGPYMSKGQQTEYAVPLGKTSGSLQLKAISMTPTHASIPKMNHSKARDKIVICSSLSLKSVPKQLPIDTLSLDLSNNSISALTQCQFCNLIHLQYLDLSNNNLTYLDNGSFESLSELLFLDMSNNNLNEALFQDELFNPLPQLKALRINNCNYTKYPDQSIGKLYNLETLTLDGFSDQVLGDGFRDLTHLTYLSMSGWESRCSINKLTSTMFSNTPYLQYLNISACNISQVDETALSPLKSIFVFNMSDNHGLALVRNICAGLRNTSIQVLILDHMEKNYGHAFHLKPKHVELCNNLSLRLASLKGNKIDYIHMKAALLLPQTLEILYVTNNRFSMQNYFRSTTNVWATLFPCLRKFYVGNYLNGDYRTFILYKEHLKEYETNIFSEIKSIKHEAGCKNISQIRYYSHNTESSMLRLPKTIEELYVSNLYLNFYIPKLSLLKGNKLSTINLMGNNLYKWKGPIHNIANLTKLDLSINYCGNVGKNFFSGMDSLKWLNLRINYLGNVLSSDSEGEIFKDLHNLRYLNLHLNRITLLPRKLFNSLPHLETLDLSSNSLTEFVVDISHMNQLSSIVLCNNELNTIPEDTRLHLDLIATHKRVEIDISDNRIECTCSNIDFLKWLNKTSVHILRKEASFCQDKKWYATNFTHLDYVIKLLERDCQNWSGFLAGISVTLSLLILIILIVTLYRKRWTLEYIYYTTLGRYRLIHEEHKDSRYKYDAFVSYDNSDREFVIKEMLHYLETHGDLNLCIHERDFTPGNAIAANVVESIRDSRRTVCLMSKEFLKSKWCMFEFNMAKMESMFTRGGRPVHFLVLLDSFGSRDLPLEVLDVIESQSYIEYPNDEFGNIIFWDKLRKALRRLDHNMD